MRAGAVARFEQSAQHADDRRLAGPVRAEKAEDGLFLDGKADVIDRREVPEPLGEIVALDHRVVRHCGNLAKRSL